MEKDGTLVATILSFLKAATILFLDALASLETTHVSQSVSQ